LPEKVVLESGRPVVVIPFIGAPQTIGKRVMVAWNASRESVRAVNDALPVLVQSDTVEVLAINPPAGETGDGDIPCADICLHLARHGVNAVAESMQAADISVGDVLLSRAADRGVDLIVMGAYGHSRFREIVLSGVSRRLFNHMTVPVLFSH
jgi:nucleotide-binding universal stress UspA family protein